MVEASESVDVVEAGPVLFRLEHGPEALITTPRRPPGADRESAAAGHLLRPRCGSRHRSPRPAGPSLTLSGIAIDGTDASDGQVAVLLRPSVGPAREVVFIDPAAGAVTDRYSVGDNVVAIDLSPDHRALLQVSDTGTLDVLGHPGALVGLDGRLVDGGW